MERSNSRDLRARSEARAGGARPGYGAEAGVAGGPSGYGAETDVANASASDAAGTMGSVLNGGLASDGTKSRSDWQLARALIKTQIRHPKSLWMTLWVLLFMPLMIMGQSFEPGDRIHWFFALCVVVIIGLSPIYAAWTVGSLRAMSCTTAVIRTSRFVVMLGYGLLVLAVFIISLRLKIGDSYAECGVLIALAIILQVGVHIQAWREAAKIEDFVSREERIKHSKLEKAAAKKQRNSAVQSGKTALGAHSRLARALSSGDVLLDELVLQPYISTLKWFAPVLIMLTYGVLFFSELVKPLADGNGGWGAIFMGTLVINFPLGLATGYHRQVLNWLALSGSRVQWWRQHVKQMMFSLWLGPASALAGVLAHISAMEVRGEEPLIELTGKATLIFVLVGLSVQLLLMGLANAFLLVANKLRGWLVGVAWFGCYVVIGVGFATALFFADEKTGVISTLKNGGAKGGIGDQAWHFGWLVILGFLVIAGILWAFNEWRYKRMDIRDSADIDLTGTSK